MYSIFDDRGYLSKLGLHRDTLSTVLGDSQFLIYGIIGLGLNYPIMNINMNINIV